MASNIEILAYSEPTIELEELSIDDSESLTQNMGDNQISLEKRSVNSSSLPIIKINNFYIDLSQLQDFTLNCSDFIPTISITFSDTHETFTNLNFPKDGDILQFYMSEGGNEKTYKPIRIDFIIKSIDTFNENDTNCFNIFGEMNVPGLNLQKCAVYNDKTTYEILQEIASDLKLGFASNFQSSNDSQVWLNKYGSISKFIKKLVSYSYIDENSFTTCYIDPYYYLNFVECNALFNDCDNDETDVDNLPICEFKLNHDNYNVYNENNEPLVAPDFLTNSTTFAGSDINIIEYGQINNIGNIVANNGYKIYLKYWDDNNDEYRIEYITPFTSEGTNLQPFNKNNDEEFVKQNTKTKFLGVQSCNVHENYFFAHTLNKINLMEINKYGIDIIIPMFNPRLIRYQKKYVQIIAHNIFSKMDMGVELDDTAINKKLSGFYMITGLTYFYNQNNEIYTKVNLRKRGFKNIE